MSAAMCPLILPVNTKDIGRNSLISVSKPIIKKGGRKGGGGLSPPPNTLNRARRASRSGSSAAMSTFSQKTPFFE